MAITIFFVVSVASMAESLTSELQNQLADIWKKSKVPTWNSGCNTYSDKQLQTAIDSKCI